MDLRKGSRKHRLSRWCRKRTKSNGNISNAPGLLHSTSPSEVLSLSEFSDDLLLNIFGFCSIQDVRQLSRVNHHFRNLISSADAFWWEFCRRAWQWLPEEVLETVDRLSIPNVAGEDGDEPNMLTLLSIAADKGSPSIDKRALQPVVKNPFCWLRTTARDYFKLSLSEIPTDDGDAAVQYTGRVGEADRSFCSTYPLPHPNLLTQKQLKTIHQRSRLPLFFCKQRNRPTWAPFVSPSMAGHIPDVPRPIVNMTPCLISYFEATIQPLSPEDQSSRETRSTRASAGESVGIGLAMEQFRWFKRMPGKQEKDFRPHCNTLV